MGRSVLVCVLLSSVLPDCVGFYISPGAGLLFRAPNGRNTACSKGLGGLSMQADEHDILLRVARGEEAERTPVWLMRQAGRYMKEFKAYSTKYPFRMRSETPDIAIELSMQPYRAFKTDGVIMFSDILTPLPSMGIEFDVVKGTGPIIPTPIRSMDQVRALKPIDDPDKTAPFLRTILESLRKVCLALSSVQRIFLS